MTYQDPFHKDMPDIPEYEDMLNGTIDQIIDALKPIIESNHPNIFVNSLLLYLMKLMSINCKHFYQASKNIDAAFEVIKMNAVRYWGEENRAKEPEPYITAEKIEVILQELRTNTGALSKLRVDLDLEKKHPELDRVIDRLLDNIGEVIWADNNQPNE